MQKDVTHDLNVDAQQFLEALLNELSARDQFTRLTRHLRDHQEQVTDEKLQPI